MGGVCGKGKKGKKKSVNSIPGIEVDLNNDMTGQPKKDESETSLMSDGTVRQLRPAAGNDVLIRYAKFNDGTDAAPNIINNNPPPAKKEKTKKRKEPLKGPRPPAKIPEPTTPTPEPYEINKQKVYIGFPTSRRRWRRRRVKRVSNTYTSNRTILPSQNYLGRNYCAGQGGHCCNELNSDSDCESPVIGNTRNLNMNDLLEYEN